MIHFSTSRQTPRTALVLLAAASLVAACGRRQQGGPEAPGAASPAPAPASETPIDGEAAASEAAAAPPTLPEPILIKDAGLATPESVLYDPEADEYLVSNVNGSPLAADGNGFISKVSPDGKILELKWIDGAAQGVTLDAPKGMALSGPYLYVSDIKWVRIFERKTGKAAGKFAIPRATFANDVAVGPDETLYVSDTAWKAGADGFEPTGTDAIHKIKGGAAKPLIADKSLASPNGLLPDGDDVWFVNHAGELGRIDKEGKKHDTQMLPQAGLDGIVRLADGSLAISSWKGSAVYRGIPGGEFRPLIENVNAPADIGYDTKRNRILIPLFNDNAVQIQPLPDLPVLKAPAKASEDEAPSGKPPEGAEAGKPAEPAVAAKPAEPAVAAKPAEPAAAAKPAEPAAAAKPATAAKPAEPATAAKPAEPATAASPAPSKK
jgi:sugar lactone lactonase YvrE